MIGKDIYFFPAVCNPREITIGTISKEIYLKGEFLKHKTPKAP